MNGAKHALNICNATHSAACAGSKRQLSITSNLTKAINDCSGTGPTGSLYAHHAIHHASNQSSGALGQAIKDAHNLFNSEAAKLINEAVNAPGGGSELLGQALGPVRQQNAKKH